MALLTSAEFSLPSLDAGHSTLDYILAPQRLLRLFLRDYLYPLGLSTLAVIIFARLRARVQAEQQAFRGPKQIDAKQAAILVEPLSAVAVARRTGLRLSCGQVSARAQADSRLRCPALASAALLGAIASQLPMLPRLPKLATAAVLLFAFALQMGGVCGQITSDEQDARIDVADGGPFLVCRPSYAVTRRGSYGSRVAISNGRERESNAALRHMASWSYERCGERVRALSYAPQKGWLFDLSNTDAVLKLAALTVSRRRRSPRDVVDDVRLFNGRST